MAAASIIAKAEAFVEEGIVVASPQRPSFRREEVMEKLGSTTWLGRVIDLQGLLELVGQMIMSMQTVKVIPWELMAEQQALYDKLVSMELALRQQPLESDPRWTSTHPDPIMAAVFPYFHEEPDPKHHLDVSRIQMLMSGTYMVQELKVPEDDRRDGITDE